MRITRLLTVAGMSLMAIALIAAAGCSSENEDAKVVNNDSAPKIAAQSTVETEPEQVASLGMPVPGSEGDNVLPKPAEPLELRTRSATDAAKADNPAINTMCMAWYIGSPDEDFVSVGVLVMNSDDAAIAHYEVLHGEFENGGVEIREQKGRDRDWMTAEFNQGGIGEMAIVRIGSNLVSVHNGPTSDQAEWNSRWMLDLADSVTEQLG
jgi:hypothetical protein